MAVADKRRSTLLAILGILVTLVALNTVAWFYLRSVRIDVTSDALYTVSPGVSAIARALPEPVRIDFYWTRDQGADLPTMRSYAQRVQEFLEEIVASSEGKLELRIIDPEAFSETEDMARAAGISARTLDTTGRVLMFGLSVRGATDKVETIAFLDPSQEQFLEYEIARRILSVGRDRKSTVAVITTLPIERPFNPQTPQARTGKSVLFAQLEQLYELKVLDTAKPVVPAETSALMVIQPRQLTEEALRAIDAWAISGKPLFVFADPWCEADPAAREMDFGSTGSGSTYELGSLLTQWGVSIDTQNVVADLGFATRIMYQSQGGQNMEMSHPAWLTLNRAGIPDGDPATAPLAQLNIKSIGAIARIPGAKPTISTLITSTKDVQMCKISSSVSLAKSIAWCAISRVSAHRSISQCAFAARSRARIPRPTAPARAAMPTSCWSPMPTCSTMQTGRASIKVRARCRPSRTTAPSYSTRSSWLRAIRCSRD